MEVEWIRNELNSPQLSAAVSMVILEQHSPMRQLLFRDFCEALVRIAHVKYRHLPSLQKQLEALLQTNILPHATQVSQVSLHRADQDCKCRPRAVSLLVEVEVKYGGSNC